MAPTAVIYTQHHAGAERWLTADEPKVVRSARLKGQALVIIALMMTVLVLFVGLGVDAANLMGKKAKLQSAVDAATLSASEMLVGNSTTITTTKAYQILEANAVPASTLSYLSVDTPAGSVNQVHVKATQQVNTFFMGLVPAWRTIGITAEATADINSYAELNIKPYGKLGVVNELNISVWGVDSWRRGGDAYSAQWWHDSSGAIVSNPEYAKQPYGYLFRVDVPPSYSNSHVYVEIFDPDSYNKPGAPPAWPTPYPCNPGPQCGQPPPTPTADQYASCTNPSTGLCSSDGARKDTALKLNAFPSGRPAFWRVDEFRAPVTAPSIDDGTYADSRATTTQYTLWHFDPHITSAFGDPSALSDQPSSGYLARYTVGNDPYTDLSWYRPPGFDVQLTGCGTGDCFARESNGGFYFYLYAQGIAGSSENNFDLRAGPPQASYDCSTPCAVNEQYRTVAADWNSGGVNIFAKRAMSLNLDTGVHYPMLFSQLSKNAAGQTLGVRHFDQDCNTGCGAQMTYQLQLCVLDTRSNTYSPCADTSSDGCFADVATGYVSDNDAWVSPPDGSHPNGYPDPDTVPIPFEGSSNYAQFFGPNGECPTSWLRLKSDPSYSQDTQVWEMPFVRPRLVK